MLKRILSLVLSLVLVAGSLGACGNTAQPATTTTEAVPTTEAVQNDDGVLKVLTLGHSLALNATYMLALVAKAEGYENLEVGTLYYSGCPLYRHVQYLQTDAREYDLYTSSTADVSAPPAKMEDVTMREAIRYTDWDIIVMQGGTFELAAKETFINGNIQTIQNYVNEHKLNPNAIFVWHLPWAFSTDPDLQNSYKGSGNNPYTAGYAPYNNDRTKLYATFLENAKNFILTDETFQYLIPTGTAVENAMTSYLTEKDLLRDYAHAGDLGMYIAAYTWFCKMTGVEKLEELKLTAIPVAFFRTSTGLVDRELTEAEKLVVLESVNNALANPMEVTQSQYTQAPA